VGYGAITGAGQVVRRDVPDGHLVVEPSPVVDVAYRAPGPRQAGQIRRRNVEYIAQLAALRAWYRQVRLPRAQAVGAEHLRVVTTEALANVDACIVERWQRLQAFLGERGAALPSLGGLAEPACPIDPTTAGGHDQADHVAWVRGLSTADVQAGRDWLGDVAAGVRVRLLGEG
jgi:UDP-N-acetylglucosamine/UDP-N-acetylgalactosamine diphosphorylase